MQVMEHCYNLYLSVSLQTVIFPACVLVQVLRVAEPEKQGRGRAQGQQGRGACRSVVCGRQWRNTSRKKRFYKDL